MMVPRPAPRSWIMQMLYGLGGKTSTQSRYYPEIATAIAEAANSDPLFPGILEGAEATACLLVADAWESSKLHPYAIRGHRMGLFQIRPPLRPALPPNALTRPKSAALIAVDLIRTSVATCASMPWEERLAWYKDLGSVDGPALPTRKPSKASREMSRRILEKTQKMFKARFGDSAPFRDPGGAVEPEAF